MPKIKSFSAEHKTRRTEIEYNTKGDLLIDLVARKYTLKIGFGVLSSAEVAIVREKTEGVFCEVIFPYGSETITRDFHVISTPFSFLCENSDGKYYSDIELVLEEK